LARVADLRDEPIATVTERKEELQKYSVMQARFMITTFALHPLLSPFTSSKRNMSRLSSLNLYLLQVNLVQLATLVQFYKNNDSNSNDQITNNQIQMVMQTLLFASVFLLPVVSEPLTWLATAGCLNKTDSYIKWLLVTVNQILGLTLCVLAGTWCTDMTVNHQFCLVMSLSIALVLGTFGWNILRAVMNWVLAPFRTKNCAMRALTASIAEQIYLDMEAVKLA
jgi:hypothetical protein